MKRVLAFMLPLIAISGLSLANSRVRSVPGARLDLQRIAASFHHTCSVFDDGTVHCWGANDRGQLGDGTVSVFKSPPVQVSGVFSAYSVAVGFGHSCALRSPGVVSCWGDNGSGQLGNGTFTNSLTAVPVKSLESVKAIAAGSLHTCALRSDGTVWCWGNNANGSLGAGLSATVVATPVKAQLTSQAVAITAGTSHTCAVLVDGSAQCWGANSDGQLGNSTNTDRRVPVTVNVFGTPLKNVIDITAGSAHTCALLSTGTMDCWGRGTSGQLGNGNTTSLNFPTSIFIPSLSVVAIAAGDTHTCALGVTGEIECWGDNISGQLGTGDHNMLSSPGTKVPGYTIGVEITAGSQYTCALDGKGIGECWGRNAEGELGNGTTNGSSFPISITGVAGTIDARFLASGPEFNCAGRGSGVLSCWGANSSSLGNGKSGTIPARNPVDVAVSPLFSASLADEHACGLAPDGRVACWGDNAFGDVGDNSTTERDSPVFVMNGASALAAGSVHTCALHSNGTVSCWGSGVVGQLGNGIFADSHIPVPVSSLDHVVSIASGDFGTCAVRDDGTVSCWGNGSVGQLGNGATGIFSNIPVPVTGLSNAIAVAAGSNYFCALLANGGVSCWGSNGSGQLGNSNTQQRSVPDAVSGLQDAVAIDAGDNHTCAVRAEGSAVCWGDNSFGDLGAATADSSLVPVPVIATFATINGIQIPIKLSNVVGIGAGERHTCALLAYGKPVCWGSNLSAEIGDGTFVDRPRPTAVNSYTANVAPVADLQSNARFAVVTVLINCPVGGEAHIQLTLTQGNVYGSESNVQKCEGGLIQTPFTLPARGPAVFQPGVATAQVEALVKDSTGASEDQHWTRAVTLVVAP